MKNLFFHQESRELEVINSQVILRYLLDVGPGHIKFLQPGLELASNLNDLHSQGLPKSPQPGPELSISLNEPYIMCMARGSPKLPQPGPRWLIA